jgi:myo-inositol-1(or 4)-monophosphatase
MNRFLEETKKIILSAGKMAKDLPLDSRVLIPKGQDQFFTQGDLNVENYVIGKLKEQFPDHGFDSEEMGQENSNREYVWMLDPIDGSKYYARNIPLYAISLALRKRDKLVLGVVYIPESNQMYCASLGEDATLNGQIISCSSIKGLKDASIYLEIPSGDCPLEQQKTAMKKMALLIQHTYRVRIIGVGSLGLCFCSSGGFDAYVNLGSASKACDIAAGEFILRRAGGQFIRVGTEENHIIAGPAKLCSEIQALINF